MPCFDHTLITRRASVGVIPWKRAACIHLESTSYDWFGVVQHMRDCTPLWLKETLRATRPGL